MFRKRLPVGAIKQKMIVDNISKSDIEKYLAWKAKSNNETKKSEEDDFRPALVTKLKEKASVHDITIKVLPKDENSLKLGMLLIISQGDVSDRVRVSGFRGGVSLDREIKHAYKPGAEVW